MEYLDKGLIYDYIRAIEKADIKSIEELISDEALIELVNTFETYDKGSYLEYLNLKMIDSAITISRCSDYNKDNEKKGFSIVTYKSDTNYKVVSFYDIDKDNNKINRIEEYWFNIF